VRRFESLKAEDNEGRGYVPKAGYSEDISFPLLPYLEEEV
jgi:hypothetical protein